MSSIAKPVKRRARWIIPLMTALALFVDVICKELVRATMLPGEASPFIPGVRLFLTTNTGAAFSLGAQNGYLMTSLATVVTLFLVAWMLRREAELVSNLERIGLGLLFGGACGNLYDRFTQGRVTDFLDFTFIDFPIFNTADIFIDVGIGLILLAMLMERKPLPRPGEQPLISGSLAMNLNGDGTTDHATNADATCNADYACNAEHACNADHE